MLSIEIRRETLQLWPERAVYWPRRRTLLIADPHFGKSDGFHHFGIPIPPAVTPDDLDRLQSLLRNTRAKRLVILGDFFHNRHSQSDAVLEDLAAWRRFHARLDITLIRGNHDLHAGDPPLSLGIVCRTEPAVDPPFVFCHDPRDAGEGYGLAGHIHPGVSLRDGHTRFRFPCFCFSASCALLPAFTLFSGLQTLTPSRSDRVFLVHEDRVMEWKSAS